MLESLEDRRMMSVNEIYGSHEAAQEMRAILLDDRTRADFAEAADLSQYSSEFLEGIEQWAVLAQEGVSSEALQAETGLDFSADTGIIPWSYVVDAGENELATLIDSLADSDSIEYFYPLDTFEIQSLNLPDDLYLGNQWGLINFGQNTGNPDFAPFFGEVDEDINIEEAWNLVTGEGVVIGIVDDGLLGTHPDLIDNYRPDLSIDLVENDDDPTPTYFDDGHGTSVAGIAAAAANDIGVVGVAYNAELAGIRLFSDDPTAPAFNNNDLLIAASFLHESEQISVYNHSWGPTPPTDDNGVVENPRAVIELGPLATTALRNSVFFGRGGLGGIHVFSAGNSVAIHDSGNYSETVNSRYTIGVTGVIHTGEAASYAESSAATLVAAPTGSNPEAIIRDEELGSGIYTTDLLGDDGFNEGPGLFGIETDADFLEDTDYTSRFNGTSASAPFVSGVIALMLEANPSLSYRDVQHILVRSARQQLPEDLSWAVNNRSFMIDPEYDATNPPPGDPTPYFPFGTALEAEELVPELLYTNGAGFTVSQYNDDAGQEFGFAHGVVDAALAVQMAFDWRTVGDQRSEATWTTGGLTSGTIAPGAVTDEDLGQLRIPGGIVGDGRVDEPNAFIDYFNEYASDDEDGPFSGDDPPVNTRGTFITIAEVDPMAVEWVEVDLDLGGEEDALDFLRISLVSPSGTVSELKPHALPTLNAPYQELYGPGIGIGVITNPQGVIDPGSGGLDAVFTTNRHWGERSDDGEGAWSLIFENFSDSAIDIQSFEVAFHGIGVPTDAERVMGAVAVLGEEGEVPDFARTTIRGETDFAEGVRVYGDFNGDNIWNITEPYFVTGHDGNFYFDFAAESTYQIRVDGGVNGERLPEYLRNDMNIELVNSADFEFGDMAEIILNPNAVPDEIFTLRGVVYSDLNLDGMHDEQDDTGIPAAVLFIDIDQNGVYSPGVDPFELSAGDGTFEFTDVQVQPGFYSVSVLEGSTGSFSEAVVPENSSYSFFFDPNAKIEGSNLLRDDLDFGFTLGEGSVQAAISGEVFNDANANGIKDAADSGLGGVATVYIDLNDDNAFDPSDDIEAVSSTNGTFSFIDIPSGSYVVRIEFDQEGYTQTTPSGPVLPNGTRVDEDDWEINVTATSGTITTGLQFGLKSNAVFDFGDLPSEFYRTLLGDDGARHTVFGDLYLGSAVDTELEGNSSNDALGDDNDNVINDEDGVTFTVFDQFDDEYQGIIFEDTETVIVTVEANTNGGYLHAWFDFNGNNAFDASEYVIQEVLLSAGETSFDIPVPEDLTDDYVYARFRYGEAGPMDYFGAASRGEVEDYRIEVITNEPPDALIIANGPDFDGDNQVTGFDFLAWQRGFNNPVGTVASTGDANGDRITNGEDLAEWEAAYGSSAAAAPGDFDGDGEVSGSDFLALQRNFGMSENATVQDGDANGDGSVNQIDLAIWESGYGANTVAAATASEPLVQEPSQVAPLLQGSELIADSSPVSTGPANSSPGLNVGGPSSATSVAIDSSAEPAGLTLIESPQASVDSIPLVASVLDTGNFGSEVERLFRGRLRIERDDFRFSDATRFESYLQDVFAAQFSDFSDFGSFGSQDVRDSIFGRLDREFEELSDWSQREADLEEAAGVVGRAFEELRDWRFS